MLPDGSDVSGADEMVIGTAQSSIPRCAGIPALNACLTICISVTVSASSMISGGQRRPVSTTWTWLGRAFKVSSTSAIVNRQPAVDQRVGDLVQLDDDEATAFALRLVVRLVGGWGLDVHRFKDELTVNDRQQPTAMCVGKKLMGVRF